MVSQVNTWYLRRTHCISGHATFYVQRTQYETYVCVKRPNVLGERKNVLGKRKNVLECVCACMCACVHVCVRERERANFRASCDGGLYLNPKT
jgi:hypothetical protein